MKEYENIQKWKGAAFSSKYKSHYLMYYETYNDIRRAIEREKNMKNWHRQWKINLIMENNPEWKDLAEDL